METLYYIQNQDAGYLGNAPIFWAQDRCGYTANLKRSHKFTYEEAKKICLNNPVKNKAYPCEYIDNLETLQTVVDSQFLDYNKIENFNP